MLDMPASIANLYSYGIIDHIPYEVYDNTPPSHTSGYPAKQDYFPKDEFKPSQTEDESYREAILKEKETLPKPVFKSASSWKGLLSLAFIIATPFLIFKGIKNGLPNTKKILINLFTKINLKNIFKKK